MSTPTTRRHPRTLAEAWPREHANPIHFYPRPGFGRWAWPTVCLCAAVLIGWLAFQGL